MVKTTKITNRKRIKTINDNGGAWNKGKHLSKEHIEKLKKTRPTKQGSLHHNSKLKEEDVISIIKLLKQNKTQNSIALLFNVSRSTIKNIKEKRNWKYLNM